MTAKRTPKPKPSPTLGGDEILGLLERLRAQGVAEFSGLGFTVKFGDRASLTNPLNDNTHKPDSLTPSKREEVKDKSDEDLLFHSTPFGG